MTVKQLIAELQKHDENADVFVSCEGYGNYDPESDGYWCDDDTHVVLVNGRLYVADSCHIYGEEGY